MRGPRPPPKVSPPPPRPFCLVRRQPCASLASVHLRSGFLPYLNPSLFLLSMRYSTAETSNAPAPAPRTHTFGPRGGAPLSLTKNG